MNQLVLNDRKYKDGVIETHVNVLYKVKHVTESTSYTYPKQKVTYLVAYTPDFWGKGHCAESVYFSFDSLNLVE